MVFLGPRGQHLPLRRRRAPGGPGPLRVPPVLEPVPDLRRPTNSNIDRNKTDPSRIPREGNRGGIGLRGERGRFVELGRAEVAEVLLHLRHLRVREPERGAPAARRPPHPPPPALLRVAR